MIPVADARRTVLSACAVLDPVMKPADEALGHVLAETVRAPHAVPPFDNSAMDGYAVRAADTVGAPVHLQVVAAIMAGDGADVAVGTGQAVRIMTGAPLPAGADAVCMLERTRSQPDGSVVIDEELRPGTNVRRAGEDIAAGDEVFAAGVVLGPPHIGVLASLGIGSVLVHPRPTVGVLSTGDELAATDGPLAPGMVRDANRPALVAQLRSDGFAPIDLGICGDDEVQLTVQLQRAVARCDAVVTSGGVSVGDRDALKHVLARLAGVGAHLMQVAVKPAKPFAFAVLAESGVPVFGVPGNPVSALISYELFVRPALRQMAGHRHVDRPRLSAVAGTDLPRRRDGKLHLVRVTVRRADDGTVQAHPSGGQGSHQLHAMAGADALALLPDGDGVRCGDPVDVVLLGCEGIARDLPQAPW